MTTADQSRAQPYTPPGTTTAKRQKSTLLQQQRRWGWIFLSPWIIGFTVFTVAPIIASLIFSFTDFQLSDPTKTRFIGLDNWKKLFNDPTAINSLGVTLKFAVIAVPIAILLPLGLATLMNAKALMGKRLFRLLFYMPYMVPTISGILIWQSFLNGQSGWLNRGLALIGIEAPNWLQNEATVLPAMVIMGLWGSGNAMLTMLATMQGVPTELYEAARVDGAGAFVQWLRITLPMISPVIFYNLILSVIGLLQFFTIPFVVTQGTGSPNGSLFFFNMHLYKTAFLYQDMGYGATLAWFIFIIALVLTIIMFATSRRWVYYASGD